MVAPDSQGLLPQYVKRALAFMRDNLAERITLAELTAVCGVSERTLLKQFQEFLGVPPLTYLRRLRLHAVRSELTKRDNNEPIADIAIRCGFTHLGRFAAEYRRQFNETPSAARQRARTSAAGLGASPLAPQPRRERPSLLILPLRTETLQESIEARDLSERLAAALSRMHIASVRLAHPSHCQAINAPQPRNARTEYCLLGRLSQRGERLRVIVRLIDVAADRHIWGDSFDGSANDPFELQNRVADGVLCGVVSHITEAVIERASKRDARDADARDIAMQAVHLLNRTNVPSARNAMAMLKVAVDMDPGDALSVGLLAYSHAQLAMYHGTTSPGAAREAALNLSRRASMLDDNDPLVTTARAAVASLLMQPDDEDALVARAMAMDPTCAWAWERRGFVRLRRAEDADRAISDFRRALQLRGPRAPSGNCFHGIAAAHYEAGRLEDAVSWLRRALAEDPDADWRHKYLACCATRQGDLATVTRSVDCLRRARPHLTVPFLLDSHPHADPDWLDALVRSGMSP